MDHFRKSYGDDLDDVYIDDFEGDSSLSTLDAGRLKSEGDCEEVPCGRDKNEGVDNNCACPLPKSGHLQQFEDTGVGVQRDLQNCGNFPWTVPVNSPNDGGNIWGPITTQSADSCNMAWFWPAADASKAEETWSASAEGIVGESALTKHAQTDYPPHPASVSGQAGAQTQRSGFAFSSERGDKAAARNTHQSATPSTMSLAHSQNTFQWAAPIYSTWLDDAKQTSPQCAAADQFRLTPPHLIESNDPAASETHRVADDGGAGGTDLDGSLNSDFLDSGQFWLMVQKTCISEESITTVEPDVSAWSNEAQQPFSRSLPWGRQPVEKSPWSASSFPELDSTPLDELLRGLGLDSDGHVDTDTSDSVSQVYKHQFCVVLISFCTIYF